jgi:hypothetical protein
MDREELINHTKRILDKVKDDTSIIGTYAEACDLIRMNAGPNSPFLATLEARSPSTWNQVYKYTFVTSTVRSTLQSFLEHVESGLFQEISPERRAQLDVVSDFLEMANALLETKGVHPAAAAVLIGATLEEFLRTWIEAESLSLDSRKPGLETYSQILREANLITKQDGKDITSWAGIRNHAAHGEWDEVSEKNRISLMLEGVNLFMRKYSP